MWGSGIPNGMYRRFWLLLLVLCTCALLAAGHRESSISVLMYNDSLTLGLSENQDDLRSYGTRFLFSHSSGWYGRLDMSGLTHRTRNEETGSRYDEVVVLGGKIFHFPVSETVPRMTFQLSPHIGLLLAGDMQFETMQNLVHFVLDIDEVELPYETEGVAIRPYVGLSHSFDYLEPAPWFSVSDLVFTAKLEGTYVPAYAGRLYAGIAIGHRTPSTSELLAGIGYVWESVMDGWPSHELVSQSERGLIASVNGHFGILAFSYRWYLDTLQGYGGLGFDIGLGLAQTWERNDLLLSLGSMLPSRLFATSLRYVVDGDFGIVIENLFKMIPVEETARVRENISSWHVGVDYEFSRLQIGLMRPFASLSLGVRRYLVMMDADPGAQDSNGRVRESDTGRFSMNGAVGVRFFPDGEIQYGKVAYGFQVSGGLLYVDVGNLGSAYPLMLTDSWEPYLRVGLTIGSKL